MKKLFSVILSSVIIVSCFSGLWSVSGSAEAVDEWYACTNNDGTKATISESADGVVSVSGNGTVLTNDTYDITKYDLKFKTTNFATANDGSIYIGFSIAKPIATDKITANFAVEDAGDRLDFQIYSSDKKLRLRQSSKKPDGSSVNPQPTYNTGVVNSTIEHTFGVRQVNGKWYPAIDGVIYRFENSSLDYGRADIINKWIEAQGGLTNFRFGFVVKSNGTYTTAADISVVESLDFVKHSGTGTVTKQESGYALSGKADFLTDDAYDITKTDITFTINQANPNFRLTLAKNDVSSNISVPTELAILSDTNKTRLDFIASNENTNYFYIREIKFDENNNIQNNGFAIYSTVGAWSDKTTYTFGLRKDGEHWYPAVNGKIIKANANNGESLRLDDFIDTNGTVLRFGIGGRNDTFNAVDVKLTYNGTYSADNFVTLRTYLLGVNNEIDKFVYDCNNDGIMDIRDLVAIKKAIAK